MRRLAGWTLLAGCSFFAATAATPPAIVNYQGVLRSAAGAPLSGTYDMTFRFFDASIGGNEILIDAHQASTMNPVVVSSGLFATQLGSGAVSDGGGPGVYASLAEVFRDYAEVWMEILVGGETLSPRVRVTASAYAFNASNFDGRPASRFLDTSTTSQVKTGPLTVNASAPSSTGLTAIGDIGGGYFATQDNLAQSWLSYTGYGIRAQGNVGGVFFQQSGTGTATLASSDHGIDASGASFGGYFADSDGTSRAIAGFGNTGIDGLGAGSGGHFKALNLSGEAWAGYLDQGLLAQGTTGGTFFQTNGTGSATLASGNHGIDASGSSFGGYFADSDGTSRAIAGFGDTGIDGLGAAAGGHFKDQNNTGEAWAGYADEGVHAQGSSSGGYFKDTDGSGLAFVGYGDLGVDARGTAMGGIFRSLTWVADAYLAFNNWGVYAYGGDAGAFFSDSDDTGLAYVGYGPRGIWAKGTFAGGTFSHPDNVTFWADVATPTRKIQGTGAVSFVQNHPYEKDRTIAYAAPEGDEVAVYTRGTARLVHGEAHVTLGETFQWVANPDVGLTAHITPVGAWSDLYVASKSTTELVVKSRDPDASDMLFDYIVYGLRIGFEDLPIVQPKQREAFLPAAEDIEGEYRQTLELREFSARERFVRMDEVTGTGRVQDLSRSRALAAAVNEGRDAALAAGQRRAEAERAALLRPEIETTPRLHGEAPTATSSDVARAPGGAAAPVQAATLALSPHVLLPVSGTVVQGDVLAIDVERPGFLRAVDVPTDRGVVGCAVAPDEGTVVPDGQALVAVSGVVACRADATYGAIHPGDLLVASATPGHAMRAEAPAQGTVLGKAMEPLEAGSGLIRVLVSPR